MMYALDSDIISYILKGYDNARKKFNHTIGDEDLYCIPPLVYYEVKRGLDYLKATAKLKEFKNLYDGSIKSDMTTEIWEKAIEIYVRLKTKGKIVGDGDIFIAAFCIVNDYTLITNNLKHYGNIEINLMG